MKRSIGIRTTVYPTPVLVVGTYDKEGRPNAMTAAWGGICCSQPPCVNISLRKATYTYGNIMDRNAFTINIPSEDQARQADYFGMASGRYTNKFSEAGLTPMKGDLVDAPYVKEFPLVLECNLIQATEIGLHTIFVGEIMNVLAEDSILGEDGLPDIEKIKPMIFAPESRKYYGVGKFLGKAFSIGKDIKAQ